MARKVDYGDDSAVGTYTKFYKAKVGLVDRIRLLTARPVVYDMHYNKIKNRSVRCSEDEFCAECPLGDDSPVSRKFGAMVALVGQLKEQDYHARKAWKPVYDETIEEGKSKKERIGRIMKWGYGPDKMRALNEAIKTFASEHNISIEKARKICLSRDWVVTCADEQKQKLTLIPLLGERSMVAKNEAFTKRYNKHKNDMEEFLDRELERLRKDSDTAPEEGEDFFEDDEMKDDMDMDDESSSKKKKKKKASKKKKKSEEEEEEEEDDLEEDADLEDEEEELEEDEDEELEDDDEEESEDEEEEEDEEETEEDEDEEEEEELDDDLELDDEEEEEEESDDEEESEDEDDLEEDEEDEDALEDDLEDEEEEEEEEEELDDDLDDDLEEEEEEPAPTRKKKAAKKKKTAKKKVAKKKAAKKTAKKKTAKKTAKKKTKRGRR